MKALLVAAALLCTCSANARQAPSSETENGKHVQSNLHRAFQDSNQKDAKASNPFLYSCTSNNDCDNKLNSCHMTPIDDKSTWFCNCFWKGEQCTKNKDCCTNICDGGTCTRTGGRQGTVCGIDPDVKSCADGYRCRQWGDAGYCDKLPTTTTRPTTTTTRRTTTTRPQGDNPYLYPCLTNSDCTNELHTCVKDIPGDSTSWFCNCYLSNGPCTQNMDCCNNMCQSNRCATGGGGQGTVCRNNFSNFGCQPGCQCIVYDDYGYCQC